MGYRAREESQKRAWKPYVVRKSCLQREKPMLAAMRQVFLSRPPSRAREAREHSPRLGGSPFLGTLYMVHTSCVSNTP